MPKKAIKIPQKQPFQLKTIRHGMFRTRCCLLRKPSAPGMLLPNAAAGQSREHSKSLEPCPQSSPIPQPFGAGGGVFLLPSSPQHLLEGKSHPTFGLWKPSLHPQKVY